jgi:hypothetical protein
MLTGNTRHGLTSTGYSNARLTVQEMPECVEDYEERNQYSSGISSELFLLSLEIRTQNTGCAKSCLKKIVLAV